VSGSNIAKFSVVIEDASDEPTIVKWKPCNIAASNKNNTTAVVSIDRDDPKKIVFNKSGRYIIIGRVAGRLRKSSHKNNSIYDNGSSVHLDLFNSFGVPLQILPEIVSFDNKALEKHAMTKW
jgi:hypothetical protein